jgi:hypothetical protein
MDWEQQIYFDLIGISKSTQPQNHKS